MPESMTPVEIAAKAHWERTSSDLSWEELQKSERENYCDYMRAALRALAEMKPTWGMLLMSKQAYFEETAECVTDIWKAMTLAAASEGEEDA